VPIVEKIPSGSADSSLHPNAAHIAASRSYATSAQHGLINEGGVGDSLFFVLSLRESVRQQRTGREFVIDFHASEYVGEMSLDGARRSAS